MTSNLTTEELETLKTRYEQYNLMCDLYNNDPRFKRFVDRACKMYDLHKDICLLHATVQEVGKYYKDNPEANDILCKIKNINKGGNKNEENNSDK